MSYTYNDSTMMIATQIAYLDFDGCNTNVGEKIDGILNQYGVYKDGKWELKPGNWSTKQKEQFDTAANIIYLSSNKGGTDEWRNWNVVDVCDDQNDSGYYGMLIDTGDGNAIIGSRGSESTDFSTGYKDWVEADVGLLDNELTYQQKRAEAYMEKIWYKYGDKYDSFNVTGHSLGGNLSQHMTITAPKDMRDKIERCVSFDGPGFSEEYIEKNKKRINEVSDKMDHYQWSWVGSLLTPLPNINYNIIKAHDDRNQDNGLVTMFFRHATYNVEFNEDGSVQYGEQSELAKVLGPITKYIDGNSLEELAFHSYMRNKVFNIPYLPNLYEVVIGLKLIAKAMYEFKEIKQQLISLKNNIYYKYIAPRVSGDYEINLIYVNNLAGEIQEVEHNLQSINNEIESIRRNLRYWSSAGAYYKSNLFFIKNGLESDLKLLKRMSEVASNAANTYRTADDQVKELFE